MVKLFFANSEITKGKYKIIRTLMFLNSAFFLKWSNIDNEVVIKN